MGKIPLILFSLLLLASCDNKTNSVNVNQLDGKNWAEKLGYPVDSKVVMLHADDIGTVYYTHLRAHETLR